MTIFILAPDKARCHPFYVAQQLETAAWGNGATETEARARMMEHRKYKPEIEEAEEEKVKSDTHEH